MQSGHWRVRRSALLGAISLLAAAAPGLAGPVALITPDEAALPDATPVAVHADLSDGPEILVASPEPGVTYRGAFPIDVQFRTGKSGEPVNEESLRIIYQKLWGIDITPRIRAYMRALEIHVPEAEFPVGEHTVQIYIEDVRGNASSRRLTVTVLEADS